MPLLHHSEEGPAADVDANELGFGVVLAFANLVDCSGHDPGTCGRVVPCRSVVLS